MAESKLQLETAVRRQPDAVRGDMLRVNTSVMVVLVLVLALALLAVVAGVRASRNLRRAELAEAEAANRLWNAFLAQARAVRAGGSADRRTSALTVLSNASAIRPSLELRNEAIASLALDELQSRSPLIPLPTDSGAVGFDATLKRYAIGGTSGEVEIHDLDSQRPITTLSATNLGPGTRLSIRSLAFDPDGIWLGARYHGGAVVVWEIATGRVAVAAGVGATTNILGGVLFDAARRQVHFVSADRGGEIAAYDLDTGLEIHHAVHAGTHHFRFHPDGNRVAVAHAEDLRVFDFGSGAEVDRWVHDARTVLSTWSPDGRVLAVACQNGDVYLRDVDTGKFAILRGHTEACLRLSFSPDGTFLATGSRDGTSRIWDVRQRSLVAITDAGVITHFGPSGRDVAVVRPNHGLLTMCLVRGVGLDLLQTHPDAGELLSVDLSPSGKWCVATQHRGFHLLYFGDTDSEDRRSFVSTTNAASVRILPDETGIVWCHDEGLEFRSLPSPTNLSAMADLPGHRWTMPGNVGAKAVAISLDGRTAAVELKDLRIVVLDLKGSRAPVFLQGNARARFQKSPASPTGSGRFALSPDGRWVSTGFGFGVGTMDRPTVWDAATGALAAVLTNETGTVAFSPEGRWLGVAGSAGTTLYSVPDWRPQRRIPRLEPATTHGSLAWSADGRDLALTATRQQSHLLDHQGRTIAALGAPVPQSLNAIRMSHDGRVIVAATVNDLLQIWRLDRLRPELRNLGLDWGGPDTVDPKPAPSRPTFSTAVLLASLFGLGSVTVFALVALRRHRLLIEQYLAADQLARERSRDLETARVELMHSQKMKALGTLAAGIAHDFNNLLSVIRMSNKLIGREAPSHAEITEHVGTIEEAVQQGKQVVGSMLGYSRPAPEPGSLKRVDEMVEETVAMLSREFLNGIMLTLELDRDLPGVALGGGKLEQILLNLVVNASEAMQGRGRLRIAARRRRDREHPRVILAPAVVPEYVEVTVEDNGPGIPADIRDRIFEPFFTTKRDGRRPGTGLGLSMVYTIAQAEGLGLVLETSTTEGTRFRVWIPTSA